MISLIVQKIELENEIAALNQQGYTVVSSIDYIDGKIILIAKKVLNENT